MVLSELAAYLKRKQQVSLSEVSVVFGLKKEVIESMAAHFIRKGWLICHQGEVCHDCRMSCAGCEVVMWYEWCDVKGGG
jgi:hypothetical protein